MKKMINHILNIIMGTFIGVFIGSGLYKYWHFQNHPDLYVIQSAPWYTSILINGLFTLVLLSVCMIVKVVLIEKIGLMKKNSIDCRNHFSGFNIYRRRICSYKSWTSKCRICSCTGNLGYNVFRIL